MSLPPCCGRRRGSRALKVPRHRRPLHRSLGVCSAERSRSWEVSGSVACPLARTGLGLQRAGAAPSLSEASWKIKSRGRPLSCGGPALIQAHRAPHNLHRWGLRRRTRNFCRGLGWPGYKEAAVRRSTVPAAASALHAALAAEEWGPSRPRTGSTILLTLVVKCFPAAETWKGEIFRARAWAGRGEMLGWAALA